MGLMELPSCRGVDPLEASSVAVCDAIGEALPIVATVPHGGTLVPGRFAADLLEPARQLWSDWHTAEL